jgi:periplasmic protein TonB
MSRIDSAFDSPRRVLPRVAAVFCVHALLLFALIVGDRILRPATPQSVMLLTTILPEVVKPPPPPPPPPRPKTKVQPPAREAAAPPLRDIEVVPRTDIAATIVDNALAVDPAGGKPEGNGTAGAGNAGAGAGGAGGGEAPITVRALIDPDNCELPKLPASAERRRLTGDVIVALLIGIDGKIKDVRLARSSGKPMLDQAALEGARRCHFVAATVDKVPVPSWEPFRFSWTNR